MANSSVSVTCPRVFDCSGSLVSFDIGVAPTYASIASSSLSCLGSVLIVAAYCFLTDIRTPAQQIITLLALADFCSAFGYIVAAVNFLTHFNKGDRCNVFKTVCTIQSTLTTWSSMCSFWWTIILALYFYAVIVHNRGPLAARFLPLYHLISWGIPLAIVLPLVALGKLGYSPYAASNWCFVKDTNYSTDLRHNGEMVLIVFFAGKLWEILSYVVVTALYIFAWGYVHKTQRQMKDPRLAPKLGQVEKRLLPIPLLFILLRMWGTLQFFYSLAVATTNHDGCIPHRVHTGFMVFGILQAIGDGGQGWGNAVLYIFLSPVIRKRLIKQPCRNCLDATARKIGELLETENPSRAIAPTRSINRSANDTTPLIAAAAGEYGYRRFSSTTGTTTEPTGLAPEDIFSSGYSSRC